MSVRRKLPPLNALKAFEAAARLSGFTAAAEELFVSPGAISRHVSNLEGFLGVTLFKRGHNDVTLTPEGAAYLKDISTALSAIENASRGMAAPAVTNSLHLHALPTFAEYWLLPRLHRFQQQHPDTRIQITTSLEETDWDTDSADLSIYASVGGWNERGHLILDTHISPVCAPTFHGRDKPRPQDVLHWPLLSSMNKSNDWLRWFHACGLQPDAVQPQYQFGTSALAYKAALHGLGAVCAELDFVATALAEGSLVRLGDVSAPGSSYFVEARPDKRESPISRAFVAWVLGEAKAGATPA